MLAYKFLRSGAVGPFSGFRWPTTEGGGLGDWVTPEGAPPPFDDGVHCAGLDQLAYWVNEELWEAELDDPDIRPRALVGSRGRLVARIDSWEPSLAAGYLRACLERADEHAAATGDAREVVVYARSAHAFSEKGAAMVAFIAAHTAGMRSAATGGDFEDGRSAERSWQSTWLAAALGLDR